MRPVLFVLFFLLLLPVASHGQETTGSIDGLVKDKSGAAIPGVEVTAHHVATRADRKTITTENGTYIFTSLPVGIYEVSAELPGFKKTLQQGIELHIADHLRIDLLMEVEEIAEVSRRLPAWSLRSTKRTLICAFLLSPLSAL